MQVACQFAYHHALDDAVRQVGVLIAKLLMNSFKLAEYVEGKPKHHVFREVFGRSQVPAADRFGVRVAKPQAAFRRRHK